MSPASSARSEKNIILTGFMGTGKSTVGQLVAAELGREFVDMDTLIEMREGRPIPQIFTEAGEPYFRQLEAALCAELAARQGLVIATGGGALLPERNLRVLDRTGLVICLDCAPEVLWQRIGGSENRPMLAEADDSRFSRLAALLEQRAPTYARIAYHLDVTRLSAQQVARRVVERVGGNDNQFKTTITPYQSQISGGIVSHFIQAMIFSEPRLRTALAGLTQACICPLNQNKYLIPLTDELFDELQTLFQFDKSESHSEFWKLSSAVESFGKALSAEGPVVYVETEYFGGVGKQAATVWDEGKQLMSPQKADIGSINEGLKFIGVVCESEFDEFDSVGLGRYRSNEDWIERYFQ